MSAPSIIFAGDRFKYSLFCLNMLAVQFHANLRRQPFSRMQSRTLISRPSWEHSFYNFHTRPLPIFVIYPKYTTGAILRDSMKATFFEWLIAHANISALSGAMLLKTSRATAFYIGYLAQIWYSCDFARF